MLLLSCILAAGLAAAPRDVLVTVDDLPLASRAIHPDPARRTRILRDLLRVLARHGIHAVGFVKADAVVEAADRQALDLWLSAGHELGTHGDAHLDYAATDLPVYLADLERGRRSLATFLESHGRTLRWFRFPYLREGDTPEKLDAARAWLSERGLRNLPVTIETQDWAFEEPWVRARRAGDGRAAKRVVAEALASLRTSVRRDEHEGDRLQEGGALPQVLLLHANALGVEIWDPLFSWLEETGHRFAGADTVLAHPVFAERHRYVAPSGGSLWLRLRHERDAAATGEELRALLARQADAWSRGDLDAFVAPYAEDATFLSPTGVVQGRAAVRARYAARYADPAAMGTLRLDVLEIRPLWGLEPTVLGESEPGGIHGAGVTARWTLTGAGGESASGTTLLVFRRLPEGWRIVQDASM
ncbi:MAG TPA: polysaccharide deacetylase family protein [Candidatus Polarisedimenticolaceae bacterium]|nr:polysaccharide deacetylase family protein [Candidatus Polarisedimenticolaceae bacterium]